MSISSQINDIIKDKAAVDKSHPFLKLFGEFGIVFAALGILFSLVQGFKIMDYDAGTGLLILLFGGLGSWILGMLMLGISMMIDSTLKTENYMRKLLEFTLTQSGHDVEILSTNASPEYETQKEKAQPILIEDRNMWMCPICGRYSEFEHRVCDCGYAVPNDFAPFGLDDGDWLCPSCGNHCTAGDKSCSKCGYCISNDKSHT